MLDISANGVSNDGRPVAEARAAALAAGVTINGVAILDVEPALDRSYAEEVIGGPGAFVVRARHGGVPGGDHAEDVGRGGGGDNLRCQYVSRRWQYHLLS